MLSHRWFWLYRCYHNLPSSYPLTSPLYPWPEDLEAWTDCPLLKCLIGIQYLSWKYRTRRELNATGACGWHIDWAWRIQLEYKKGRNVVKKLVETVSKLLSHGDRRFRSRRRRGGNLWRLHLILLTLLKAYTALQDASLRAENEHGASNIQNTESLIRRSHFWLSYQIYLARSD